MQNIRPTPPYKFDLTLDMLSRYPHPTVDVVHKGAYWRALRVNGTLALFRVTQAADHSLAVETVAGEVDETQAYQQLSHILSADLDLKPFYAYARSQPELWRIVEPLVGIRWLRTATVYEALMTTIIEQQIAWKTAQRAQRWLVEWGGHRIDHNGIAYYDFPTPAQIAAASVEDLKPLKITFKRMQLMIDVSAQVITGMLDLARLDTVPLDEAYDTLVAIKGIGHWTTTWTLQRARGQHNYVGDNDVALQAAVNHYFYGGEGRIPAEKVRETFAVYGDNAGLAAHYTMLRWILDRY
jgi:DNA-3-methyladenine glycosylase II